MIADVAVHFDNKDPPNPHAHILCTMRSMDEHGQWNEKTKTTYALDENGDRIMGKNGKWKRIRVDTVDWNDRKYCEIWRHEWEVQQNAALEQAGRPERVDMRSFKRQGLEIAPQVHLGPAAFALEKKGIRTELGDHNRAVKIINSMFKAVRRKLKALNDWLNELKEVISDHEKIERPEDFPLVEVLLAYYDLREKERWDWHYTARNRAGINDLQERTSVFTFLKENYIYTINDFGTLLNTTGSRVRELEATKRTKETRIKDIDAILNADKTIREIKPIIEKYNSIFFKKSKEKYAQEHADELQQYKKAQRLLHKFNLAQPIDRKALRTESTRLRSEVESMLPRLESVKAELDQQMKIRSHIRKVLPDALTLRNEAGQRKYEDYTEGIQNQKKLRQLLDQSADRAIRLGGEPEQHPDYQPQQQPHQKRKHYDIGAR